MNWLTHATSSRPHQRIASAHQCITTILHHIAAALQRKMALPTHGASPTHGSSCTKTLGQHFTSPTHGTPSPMHRTRSTHDNSCLKALSHSLVTFFSLSSSKTNLYSLLTSKAKCGAYIAPNAEGLGEGIRVTQDVTPPPGLSSITREEM